MPCAGLAPSPAESASGWTLWARDSVADVASYRQAKDVEAAPAAPLFSPLELLVIDISRRDRVTRVRPGSFLARLQSLLFGIEVPRPFADPRLEALRRLVVALRGRNPAAARTAALAAGVTPAQIEHFVSQT